MIQRYVDKFFTVRDRLALELSKKHPDSYTELVRMLVKELNSVNDGSLELNEEKIHTIDDGDYQGTLLYLIPYDTYQPSNYSLMKVDYGSCSGCDTLEGIRNYSGGAPTEEQVKEYLTLLLHLVQGMKEV